jgi:hypothetical protein
MTFLRGSTSVLALCAGLIVTGGYANAADLPNTKEVAPAPPPTWWSTFTVNGLVEAGITGNPDSPPSGLNWGQLFTDKANEPLFNQGLLTVQRPIDNTKPVYDVGVFIQIQYGSDSRFTHYLGEGEYWIDSLYQLDVAAAYVQAHTPWITSGGIDFKAGQWPTLEGAETIEPDTNLFYSHSYIFNYPEPFKDTGLLAITHVNPTVDIYTAVTTGQQTSFGPYIGDNNDAPAFEGGVGLNKLGPGGAVTVLATTHIGPENPFLVPGGGTNPAANSALNYENDIVVTWTATDKITITGEGNYTRNDLTNSETYGGVGYISYQTPIDWLKINGRAEVFRDNGPSTYVSEYPGYFDFVNTEHGYLSGAIFGPPTTYLELTAGLNITPTIPASIPYLKSVIFRPEVRYDSSLNGTTPFDLQTNGFGSKSSQVTIAGDVILKF